MRLPQHQPIRFAGQSLKFCAIGRCEQIVRILVQEILHSLRSYLRNSTARNSPQSVIIQAI